MSYYNRNMLKSCFIDIYCGRRADDLKRKMIKKMSAENIENQPVSGLTDPLKLFLAEI